MKNHQLKQKENNKNTDFLLLYRLLNFERFSVSKNLSKDMIKEEELREKEK